MIAMRKSILMSGMLAASLAVLALPAAAETVQMKADLKASEEVPPNDSQATGAVEVTLDTDANKVSWKISQQGLTGDATAAHFHGPAKPGENAGPVVDISSNMAEGSADVTAEQMQMIRDGNTYVNVHTAQNPNGEIRGQVVAAQ
jgi:Cu/Zn superoxide dismutase